MARRRAALESQAETIAASRVHVRWPEATANVIVLEKS